MSSAPLDKSLFFQCSRYDWKPILLSVLRSTLSLCPVFLLSKYPPFIYSHVNEHNNKWTRWNDLSWLYIHFTHTCQLSISNSSLSSCWPTSDLCFTFTAERPSANRRQSTVRSVRGCQNVTHCRLDTASYYSYCLSCDHYIKCLQSVYVKIFGPIFLWNCKKQACGNCGLQFSYSPQ